MELNAKSFVGMILVTALAAFLVVSMLVPAIASGTNETVTIQNEGMSASIYEPGEAHTIIMDANGIKTDGGEYQPYPDTSEYGEATLLIASGSESNPLSGRILRYGSDGAVWIWLYIGDTYSNRSVSNPTTSPITITIDEEGNALITPQGGIVRELTGVMIYPDTEGDYTLTYNPYLTDNTVLYGGGNTTLSSVTYGLRFEGESEGLSLTVLAPPTSTVTGYVANVEEVTSTNLYRLSNISITVDDSVNLTYTYLFAPKTIEYDNPGYTPTTASLIGIIPLLVLTGLVIGVVGSFIRNRD